MRRQPVFVGMQAEGREWVRLFSPAAVARFDYVFTDAMTFTNRNGRRMRLWIPDEVEVGDKQELMDMLVERIVGIMDNEPIDIYVNPTFLPASITAEYDVLWTPERMKRVIDAAVRNGVAIEINNRYRLPGPAFIRMAKQAGVKFTIGTNNADRDLGRIEYALQMIRECGLTWQNMWMPRPDGRKPIQARGFKNN
jgi:histidinol phosphatase-like PHP family hydrolase